jgi:hypothetical protein
VVADCPIIRDLRGVLAWLEEHGQGTGGHQ